MNKAQRVLVIAPAWVGDMVMAQVLFSQLKAQGISHLAILAPKWTLAVAERMPEVDELILGDFAHGQVALSARRQLGKSLIGRFDTAIILPKSLKSALVPFFAKIPRRIGYVGELRYGLLTDARRLDKKRLPKTIQRFAYLGIDKSSTLPPLTYPQLLQDSNNQARLLRLFNLSQPLLALCPGAEYGPSKQWHLTRVAAVAEHAVKAGCQVIALGSRKDTPAIKTMQAITPQIKNLSGQTHLIDAIDLLGLARGVLTNDSGLMHIAAAVNSSVFVVYGSTTPQMTPPLTDKGVIFADKTLACRPCFQRQCPKKGQAFMACMKATTAQQVWQAIEKTLL